MRDTCSIIVPRSYDVLGYQETEGYTPECILPYAHLSPHVFRTPKGKFIAWEDDMDCDCCAADEDERCYVHWEIEESEIPELTKGRT